MDAESNKRISVGWVIFGEQRWVTLRKRRSARSLFCLPHLTGLRVHGKAMAVPVTHRENRWLETGAACERVVIGIASVVAEPHSFASVVIWIL